MLLQIIIAIVIFLIWIVKLRMDSDKKEAAQKKEVSQKKEDDQPIIITGTVEITKVDDPDFDFYEKKEGYYSPITGYATITEIRDPGFDSSKSEEVLESEIAEEENSDKIDSIHIGSTNDKSEKFNVKNAIIYSEILKPKFLDEETK